MRTLDLPGIDADPNLHRSRNLWRNCLKWSAVMHIRTVSAGRKKDGPSFSPIRLLSKNRSRRAMDGGKGKEGAPCDFR